MIPVQQTTNASNPPTDTRLAQRVSGEFLEMPGLVLTLPQACRLWQLDEAMCVRVLDRLVRAGFLVRTANGTFRRHGTA